jgi:hypothetical protein
VETRFGQLSEIQMDPFGRNHGVIGYSLGKALWDAAIGIGDGVACLGRDFDEVIEGVTTQRVRSLGVINDEYRENKWARYEPDYGEAMSTLLHCQRHHCGPISVPFDTTDEEATKFIFQVNSIEFQNELCSAYVPSAHNAARRAAQVLSRMAMPVPWCCLHCVGGRNGPDAIVCQDAVLRDALRVVLEVELSRAYYW